MYSGATLETKRFDFLVCKQDLLFSAYSHLHSTSGGPIMEENLQTRQDQEHPQCMFIHGVGSSFKIILRACTDAKKILQKGLKAKHDEK